MAQQIKKKFIGDDQIDGSKIKLLSGEALRGTNAAGESIELIKEVEGKAIVLGQEVGTKAQIDQSLLDAKDYANTAVFAEKARAEAAEAQALADAKAYADSAVLAEKNRAEGVETSLSSAINTEKGRIDAILSASSANADSFKEIVDLINSVDATNDQAFAGYVTSNNAAVAALSSRIDVVEPKVSTLETGLASEISARTSADSLLGARLDSVETINGFIRGSIYNDSASVFADGKPGVEDPATMTRDGWYFQNTVAGTGISWYYHDGVNYPTTKAQLKNTFAVMTFDDKTAKPIFAVYSMPTGSNDVMPGFAHSKWVFQVPTASMSGVVLGKKYLVYAGDVAPTAHPELPRLQATFVSASSGGAMLSSEYVSTISLISDGTVAVNKVKWLVESVGVHSDACKLEGKLVIRHAQKANLDAEITARVAADTALSTRVSATESNITSINASLSAKADKNYVDAQDTTTLASAKAYTDSLVGTLNTSLSGSVSAVSSALEQEVLNRQTADANLQSQISALAGSQDLANETAARISADNALNSRIAALEADPVAKNYVDTQDSALSARITTLEGKPAVTFKQAKIVLSDNLAYVDLPLLAIEDSLHAFVGRLAIHKDDDFSVSVANGVTRLTFIGSLVSPTGSEKVEAGDVIRVVYAVLA